MGAAPAWCANAGETSLSQSDFGKALRDRGFHEGRTKRERYWEGIALKEDEEGDR
jgi:hypothetical protein